MEDEQRGTQTGTTNPGECQANEMSVSSSMKENDTEQNNIPRSRAALSFMEVKSIVAASFGENERRCYKVHWKDSWIYEDHLFGCEQIIEDFWREQETNEKLMPCESGILTNSKKDGENISNNTELTVIVVSKDTESEMNLTNETDDSEQSMVPDWLIARGEGENDMKENDIAWKDDEIEVKQRIIPKRRHIINAQDSIDDDSKENQDIWDNEDIETKEDLVNKKRNMLTCHICGDDFDMVSAIRRHYNTNHPGNKPFACESCGKRFDRKENLNRHIRIHTGDRRYVCNHCGKGYTDPSGLKKHVLSKHSNLVFPCQFCKATFKSKDSMNRHLTKHLQDYKSQKEEAFNVASKRQLFDDSSTSNKVFLQDGTTHITNIESKGNNSIVQAISESGISEHENSNIAQDGQENFADSETIEVQFIQLSQDGMPIETEDKIKGDLENGQFSGAHAGHAQFVLPLTTEQILKLTADAKNNIPITAEHLKNLPVTIEHLKNIPITEHLKSLSTEQIKNLSLTNETLKSVPITAEQLKNIPILSEHLKGLPITTEQFLPHINASTEQLIAASVAAQTFTYSNSDKLTNPLPSHPAPTTLHRVHLAKE